MKDRYKDQKIDMGYGVKFNTENVQRKQSSDALVLLRAI